MNIARLNEIFTTRGVAAALTAAKVAQMADWIIRALEAGQWEPGKKRAVKTADVETILGSKGDVTLYTVKHDGVLKHIIKQIRGESGKVISAEPLNTLNIAQAMKIIL